MATYAAVASLLQTLDYLLQFPRFILELKILHVEVLKPKLDELLLLLPADHHPSSELSIRPLQRFIEETDSLQRLIKETDSSLACAVLDVIEAVKESKATDVLIAIKRGVLSCTSSTSSTIPKLVEAEQIVGYIKLYEEKLGNFLHSINPDIHVNPELKGSRDSISELPYSLTKRKGLRSRFSRLIQKLKGSLSQARCTHGCGAISSPTESPSMLRLPENPHGTLPTLDRERRYALVYYNLCLRQPMQMLCRTCRFLNDVNSSLVKGTREITDLQQDLLFLLNLVKEDPSNHKCCHDHDLLKKLANVADRVRDLVEEHMVDSQINSAMKYTFWLLTDIHPQFPPYPKHLDRAVREIFNREKGIGQCLEQASKEIQLIKESIRRINDETPGLQTSISSMSLRHSNREDVVVGLDDELISLLDGLTRIPSGLEIVTILGMGGIGKTTLARKAFHHSYTVYHFYCRAWITVSQVYQVRDLLLGLLGSIVLSTDNMVEKNNAQLSELLYRSLKGMRYLIVMDDMWSTDAWNDIRRCFPDDKNGSRIVVTSRVRKLAVYINPKKSPYCMNLLDTEQSWQLLHKLVFGKESCPPGLVKIGQHIAKICQGLPLAIVVIAGVLSCVIRTYDCWNDIAEKLSSFVSTNPEECLDILALSYDFLPHHLKACFLYMAAFPEDCEIEVPKLINLWAAEGFLDTQSSINLEQIAEEYLEDLIGRNLVLIETKCFGGKVKTCRLHDFLRELCLREARKENFMHVIQRKGAKRSPVSLRNQRRLSFHLDPSCDAPAVPHVSSFLCFTLGTTIVPDILFFQLGFRLLRVLDIFFLILEYFPEPILELIHLRYLALNVTYELPASVSELRNLQTFVIHGPWHRRESGSCPTLLLEYWSMPSLRHLHCTVAIHIKDPPRARNELPQLFVPEYLRTLSTVRFSSCTKEVFSIMPHLKKLGICETEEDYSKDGPSELLENLQYLTELETLDCCFYKQNGEARLISCLSAFPGTLRELSLSWSYLPWEDMTSIAKLPRLEVLKLKNFAFQGPKWEPMEKGFQSLKHLLIENTDLVQWEATVDHFPCLEHLVLKSCKLLDEVPFGVEEIGSLLRIELHYCSEATEIAAREIQAQIDGIEVVIRSEWCVKYFLDNILDS